MNDSRDAPVKTSDARFVGKMLPRDAGISTPMGRASGLLWGAQGRFSHGSPSLWVCRNMNPVVRAAPFQVAIAQLPNLIRIHPI